MFLNLGLQLREHVADFGFDEQGQLLLIDCRSDLRNRGCQFFNRLTLKCLGTSQQQIGLCGCLMCSRPGKSNDAPDTLGKMLGAERFEALREAKGKDKDGLLLPEKMAETYYHLAQQHRSAWTHELDLRAYSDLAWLNHEVHI